MANNKFFAFAAIGGIGGLYLATKVVSHKEVPGQTTAVQGIEDRYSSGGGASDHLPGAASPRGNYENTAGNVEKTKGDRKEMHADQATR
ncbi:MAG: hypothetical protein MMC23_002217 [Stictis urceolatum]|nr:hypothetical protein [Stictis urceolata]